MNALVPPALSSHEIDQITPAEYQHSLVKACHPPRIVVMCDTCGNKWIGWAQWSRFPLARRTQDEWVISWGDPGGSRYLEANITPNTCPNGCGDDLFVSRFLRPSEVPAPTEWPVPPAYATTVTASVPDAPKRRRSPRKVARVTSPACPVVRENLPAELLHSDRAVLHTRKVPFQVAHPRKAAKVNDPSTWGAMNEALAVHHAGHSDGVGVVLGDGLIGIDLDHVRDAETGVIRPDALAIIADLDSYAEVSPSGTGVHIFVHGTLPTHGRKSGHVEMYDSGRYFTVTGQHVPGTPRIIKERTSALAAVHARIFSGQIEHRSSESKRVAA